MLLKKLSCSMFAQNVGNVLTQETAKKTKTMAASISDSNHDQRKKVAQNIQSKYKTVVCQVEGREILSQDHLQLIDEDTSCECRFMVAANAW